MTVIFDFDNTVFDTEAFKRAMAEALLPFGIDGRRFAETYRETVARSGRPCGYDPDSHLASLKDDFGPDEDRRSAREAIERVVGQCARFVFPGVREAVAGLHERGVRTVLLTVGTESWQRTKLSRSGLADAFDMVRIVERDKLPVLAEFDDGGTVVVVNDNGNEVDAMHERYPGFRFVVIKGPHALPEHTPFEACDAFEDVIRAVRTAFGLDRS